MQKLLTVTNLEEGKASVDSIHYMPFDPVHGVPQEVINDGILVDELLEVQELEGFRPILYINPNTLEQWVEYEPNQLSPEEIRLKQLEQSQADQDEIIMELLLGGM